MHSPKDEYINIRWFGGEPLFNMKVIDTICNGLTENGIYFNSYYQGKADIGKTDSSKYTVSIDDGRILDIFLWNSTPIKNIKS